MNRRSLCKLLGAAPLLKIPKDPTLHALITGKKHNLRITSYDRTGRHSLFSMFELDKIDPKQYGNVESLIIKQIESIEWVWHHAEIYDYLYGQELSSTIIHNIIIYKDHFGIYRYKKENINE